MISGLHQHAWVWSVLPPDPSNVVVLGSPELSDLLQHSGITVALADEAPSCEIMLATGSLEELDRVSEVGIANTTRLVAIDMRGSYRWAAAGRPGRAVQLLLSPLLERLADKKVRQVRASLEVAGYSTTTTQVGNKFPPSIIGRAAGATRWASRPTGEVVIGSRLAGGVRQLPVLDEIREQASRLLGQPLELSSTVGQASGKVLQYVSSDTEEFVLRSGSGPGGQLLLASSRYLQALQTSEPHPLVTKSVLFPLYVGSIGSTQFVIDPVADGAHPETVSNQLWEDCTDFVRELHVAQHHGRTVDDPDFLQSFSQQQQRLARFLNPHDRARLAELCRALLQSLSGIPVGGSHGDLWTSNLFVKDGRLSSVIDWDWASACGIGGHDLFDLFAISMVGGKDSSEPGPRSSRILLPAAQQGFDTKLGTQLRRTISYLDKGRSIALVASYWLNRVARDLRQFSPKPQDRKWYDRNMRQPLDTFCRAVVVDD